jgi:hypothetical protein
MLHLHGKKRLIDRDFSQKRLPRKLSALVPIPVEISRLTP